MVLPPLFFKVNGLVSGFIVKIGKRLKAKGKRPAGCEAWKHSKGI
jgi:hypothetical protein